MNNNCIDKNTYEIVDNVFEVDHDIVETISILNKKGYHTLYCCSGHVKDSRIYEKYPIKKIDFNYDSYVIDDEFILIPYFHTHIYIMFKKKYNFEILPKGFTYGDEENDCSVYKEITYYQKGIKKNSNDIQKEISIYNEYLLNWRKNYQTIYNSYLKNKKNLTVLIFFILQ